MTSFLRLFAFAALSLSFACAGPDPDVSVDAADATAAPERAAMPADQTKGTRNANPEMVAEEKLEEVAVRKPPPASSTATAPASAPQKETPNKAATTVEAPTEKNSRPVVASPHRVPGHSAWNALVKRYVDERGNVDYAGLRDDEQALDAYLNSLAAAAPAEGWTRNERLAYWINAYNAYTFKLILNNYPVQKITNLHGGEPWKVKWIELAGNTYSLNQIEHDVIRPRFNEPRIHFALVCAAKSCPPLANEAFTAGNLDRLLEARTRNFINNERYNQTAGDRPKISSIFDWYGEDFGDVRTYLNNYLDEPIPAGTELAYADYDWSLNEQ